MTKLTFASLMLSAVSMAVAQTQPADKTAAPARPGNENGAVQFYADSGWSFGLPAVRAGVAVGGTSIFSPEKRTLVAPSFGVTVKAWKFIAPFFDMTVYDTGKATASIGSVKQTAEADTFSVIGGVRLIAGRSRVRGYTQVGGGMLYQNMKGTLSVGSYSQPMSGKASLGAVMFGGGVQVFAGRKWGTDLGFDVVHLAQPMAAGGQNFARVKIGVFYQTKSTVQ